MTLAREILAELFGMFVADIRLTTAILALVITVAALIQFSGIDPAYGGLILFFGCHLILIEAAIREARKRRS